MRSLVILTLPLPAILVIPARAQSDGPVLSAPRVRTDKQGEYPLGLDAVCLNTSQEKH